MIGHVRLLWPISPHDEHVHVDHNARESGRVDAADAAAGFSRWRAALCPISPHTLHRYALSTRRLRRADDSDVFFDVFDIFGFPAASRTVPSPSPYLSS